MRLRLGIESEHEMHMSKIIIIAITGLSKTLGQDMSGLRNPIGDTDYWIFDPRSFAHLIVLILPCQKR